MRAKWRKACLPILPVLLIASTLAAAQGGMLDPTFGTDGIVTTEFGLSIYAANVAIANAVTIQDDGRILICGQIPSSSDFPVAAIARYNTNGSLDTSFGTAGVVTATQLGAGLNAIAVQSDGKILVAGPPGGAIVLVGRFNSNGTLDSTFGDSGVFTSKAPISSSGPSGGIVIQSNGDILVAEGLLLRLLGSGQLDSSFGSGGYATTAGYVPSGLAVLANGKILVSSAILSNPSSGGYVSRYSSNGSLDVSFGINGQLASPGPANGIALLSGGNFLISGSLTSSLTGPTTGFAVSRYLGAGITDSTFATHGGAVTPVPTYTTIMTSGQGVQSSGDIVTLGTASSPTAQAFALARYTPSGQLDTTFGTNGTVTTTFGTTSLSANGIAIQSDGKIVAVGGFTTKTETGFKLTRYLGQ